MSSSTQLQKPSFNKFSLQNKKNSPNFGTSAKNTPDLSPNMIHQDGKEQDASYEEAKAARQSMQLTNQN